MHDGSTIEDNGGAAGNTNINLGIQSKSGGGAYTDMNDIGNDVILPAIVGADIDIEFESYTPSGTTDTHFGFTQGTHGSAGDNATPFTYLNSTGFGPSGSLTPGGGSGDFGSSGEQSGVDWVPACADSDLCMDGDFTFDFWLQLQGTARSNLWGGTDLSQGIYGDSHSDDAFGLVYIDGPTGAGSIHALVYKTPKTPYVPGVTSIVVVDLPGTLASSGLGTDWHHFALTRSGTQIKIFVDGAECTSYQYGTNGVYVEDSVINFYGLKFGDRQFLNLSFAGRIDELRLIKGTAIDFSVEGIPDAPDSCS